MIYRLVREEMAWESYKRFCEKLNITPLDQPEFHLMASYLHVFVQWY